MVTYTADVSVKLRNVKVEARSEAEAEREIEAAVSEWMDGYVPLDPDGTLIDVYNVGEEEYDEDDETAETDAAADEEDEEPIELAQSSPVTLMGMVAENGPGKMVRPKSIFSDDEEEEFHNEYEDEFLSLDDLLVCISSPEIFILIWEKPYYILDRKGFEEGRDEEFIEFIKEKAKYIEA